MMKSSEAAPRRAQELAYQAMEAADPAVAISLCVKAIELDPRCVDALTMAAGAFEDAEERALHLALAVGIAEEDLGGQSYFEENKGYFWGLLETRPYMRARSYLAQTLHEAGKTEAAIAEYEALLELNPNDNQGLRYALIGLYLETGNANAVRRLMDEFSEDDGAVFAWSKVLGRLISGDIPGAERALDEARSVNPYVEAYLLGRKRMPVEMPDYYGFGDENEAIMCVDIIGDAWRKHTEAMRWLRINGSPAEAVTKAKVGRNDPCPCGSGKKYKTCCLGREDAPSGATGSPIGAEMALNEMRQAMEGKEFSSHEELNSFIQEINQQRNRKPIGDFDGLSPDQMRRFLHFPFDSPNLVTFPSCLDIPPAAPIMTAFGLLAEAIGDEGLKTTATGNLPLKLVREAALAIMGEEKCAEYPPLGSIRTETDFYDLHVTRLVAQLSGLIRKYKGRFLLTRDCRALLKNQGMEGVYPRLLRTFAERFNWAYRDGYPEIGFIQQSFLFTLYLLGRYGEDWRPAAFYEDAFLNAFPRIVEEVKPVSYSTPENTVRNCCSWRCLHGFAGFMGLIEIRWESRGACERRFKLRKAPLLSAAVRFSL